MLGLARKQHRGRNYHRGPTSVRLHSILEELEYIETSFPSRSVRCADSFMPPFQASRRLLQSAASPSFKATTKPRSALASRIAAASARNATSFPVLPECPSPTCSCQPMPAGLDIDHSTTISNNIAPYNSHILISTGQSDWTSRIEDAHKDSSTQPWGQFISQLKTAFGRKGQYHSDTQNVLITASSLPNTPAVGRTVLMFPAHEELSIPAPPSTSRPSDDSELDSLISYLVASIQPRLEVYN